MVTRTAHGKLCRQTWSQSAHRHRHPPAARESRLSRCSPRQRPAGPLHRQRAGSSSPAPLRQARCVTRLLRCPNGLRVPIDRVDQAVLTTIGGDVLRPAVLMAVVDGVLANFAPRAVATNRDQLRATLHVVEREGQPGEGYRRGRTVRAAVGRIAEPAGSARGVARLHRRLRRREHRAIRSASNRATGAGTPRWLARIAQQAHLDSRQLLREVLAGPLRFTPEGHTYRFEGEASVGRLLAGVAGVATLMVPLRGFEPRSRG